MYVAIAVILLLFFLIIVFLNQPQFGQLPKGERLRTIKASPNYKNGAFQNISPTPNLTEGVSMYSVMKEFFFAKKIRPKPIEALPSIKTKLHHLDIHKNILVWFGHSSYFMQIDGKRILVDPVFSGSASPLPFGTKAFKGSNIYTVDDMPEIDWLFISHDHWDHLDYTTIKQLQPKVKKVICGLGTGQHFEYWGYDTNYIIEKDWNETINLADNFTVHTVPARHFSGRGFSRNTSLWMSYVLQTPSMQVFIGGDSGYDKHFAEIGKTFGPFDLAILENGQYDAKWRYIHLLPNEILQAAKDLHAKRILPVHSSKFTLGNHPWDEPLTLIMQHNQTEHLNILTPLIGEPVNLADNSQTFTDWWSNVK